MNPVWTIGHSTLAADAFVELLQRHTVSVLIDVRTVPRSRHNPQFNRETLPGTLGPAGIDYRHEPNLGGLRKPHKDSINSAWKNAGFRGYADHMQSEKFGDSRKLLLGLAETRRIAVMCAEKLPWRCHRSLIADALTVAGVEVRHIMSLDEARPHRLTPFACVEDGRITYPGLLD